MLTPVSFLEVGLFREMVSADVILLAFSRTLSSGYIPSVMMWMYMFLHSFTSRMNVLSYFLLIW